MLKRYLLFCGYDDIPKGGWEDFHSSFATLDEAYEVAEIELNVVDDMWFQIVDATTSKIVYPVVKEKE